MRIFLSTMLLIGVSWIFYDRIGELQYFFAPSSLVQLGDVLSLPPEKSLPINQYVELKGILGNRAAAIKGLRGGSFRVGTFQVRHLLGSPIFVEFDQSLASKMTAYTQVTLRGRLADFSPGGELGRVRKFFETRLKMEIPPNARLLIVDEKPMQEWRYPILFVLGFVLVLTSFYFTLRRRFKISNGAAES